MLLRADISKKIGRVKFVGYFLYQMDFHFCSGKSLYNLVDFLSSWEGKMPLRVKRWTEITQRPEILTDN